MQSKIPFLFFLLLLLAACDTSHEKPQSPVVKSDPIRIAEPLPIPQIHKTDTIPLQIGNDKGFIVITVHNDSCNLHLREFHVEHLDLTFSPQDFEIDIERDSLAEANLEFMKHAKFSTVSYDFIRSNTLYFNCLLIHSETTEEKTGHFQLFYRTKRRGEIYWFGLNG